MSQPTDTVRVYQRVTAIIWQRLAPTFGIRTINAIAKNALARSTREHPALAALKVGADGLEWGALDAHVPAVGEEELGAALEFFMDEFFEAVATLIGRLVINKLFVEAEEEIRKDGAE